MPVEPVVYHRDMALPRRTRSFRRGGVYSVEERFGALIGAVTPVLSRVMAGAVNRALGSLRPCPVCGQAAPGAGPVCRECDSLFDGALSRVAPHGDTLWLGPYAGPLLRMVQALKFGSQRTLAEYLGTKLAARSSAAGWLPDCVTFVPASTAKLRVRGYDQAELLARAVADGLGTRCLALLSRTAPGAARGSQAALGRSARSVNAAGAFVATPARHRTVLLIDDVMTSGATLTACRTELLTAGVEGVLAAVVARTVRSESDLLENDDDGSQDP